jgi:hypothetical protein
MKEQVIAAIEAWTAAYPCTVRWCPMRFDRPGQTCTSHTPMSPLVCVCDEPDDDNWLGECRKCRRKPYDRLRV